MTNETVLLGIMITFSTVGIAIFVAAINKKTNTLIKKIDAVMQKLIDMQ